MPNLIAEIKSTEMHVGTPSTTSEYTLYDISVVGQRMCAYADYKRTLESGSPVI